MAPGYKLEFRATQIGRAGGRVTHLMAVGGLFTGTLWLVTFARIQIISFCVVCADSLTNHPEMVPADEVHTMSCKAQRHRIAATFDVPSGAEWRQSERLRAMKVDD